MIEVKIISRETIKPSSPTPSHLRNLTLSLFDQKYTPIIVPVLVFYGAPDKSLPLDIDHLKTCLSQTLASFYPLAGRFQTSGTLLCNDQGIPFVETQVNCPLSTLLASLSSSSNIDLPSFYPPKDNLLPSGIHLAIQVNVFTCGGFAIGLYHTHKVTDGISAVTFFRHWAALVTHRYEDAAQAQPDFNAGVTAFPPVPEEERLENNKESSNNNSSWGKPSLVRSFVFKNAGVTDLKAKSASRAVPNPTRFEAVAGFLWQQILLGSPEEGRSLLSVGVDLRSKTEPPLPKGSMGNLVETAFVWAEKRAQLPELVAEIHGSISKMKEIVSEYQGEKREEAKERYRQSFVNTYMEYKGKDVYILTSWCKSAGFRDVDFGFGKPIWVVPLDNVLNTSNKPRIIIFLTEFTDSDGDGFEAWLFLEEERIMFLESNPEFLAFATPNF